MSNKTPGGTEKHHKSTEPESSQNVEMFNFKVSQGAQPLTQKLWLPVWEAIFFLIRVHFFIVCVLWKKPL